MVKRQFVFVFALGLVIAAFAGQRAAQAQSYQEPLGSRCYQFDFGSNYGWDRYTNLCDENINISLIFPRGGGFLISNLTPGKSSGTGHSRGEYERMGEPSIFVCPSGFRPVDDADRYVTLHTERYRCKR